MGRLLLSRTPPAKVLVDSCNAVGFRRRGFVVWDLGGREGTISSTACADVLSFLRPLSSGEREQNGRAVAVERGGLGM